MNEPSQPSGFSESLHLFDSLHLAAIGISLLAIVCVPLIGRCLSVTNRRRTVWALIVFAVAQEVVDYVNRASFCELNSVLMDRISFLGYIPRGGRNVARYPTLVG